MEHLIAGGSTALLATVLGILNMYLDNPWARLDAVKYWGHEAIHDKEITVHRYDTNEDVVGIIYGGPFGEGFHSNKGLIFEHRMRWLLREPLNSLSSLFFIWAGVYMLVQARKSSRPGVMPQSISVVFGIVNMLHGFGSGWYHASACKCAGTCDCSGMYNVLWLMIVYAFQRRNGMDENKMLTRTLLAIIPAFPIFLWAGTHANDLWYCGPHFVITALVAMLFATVWADMKPFPFQDGFINQSGRTFWYPLALFLLATAFQTMDLVPTDGTGYNILCQPHKFYPFAHGVWHLLSAIALVECYKRLRRAVPRCSDAAYKELLGVISYE